MPIRPEEKARYPKDWPAISKRIRKRDGNACKWCGVPNRTLVERFGEDGSSWRVHSHNGICMGESCGAVQIVLTVAHLDHTPENCADENLAALCQRCHLRYDAKHHAETARATRERKRGQERLFPR